MRSLRYLNLALAFALLAPMAAKAQGSNQEEAGDISEIDRDSNGPLKERIHPVSGRKVLFVPPLWSSGILELPGEEGRALLAELTAHIRKPEFAYWHAYRPGDLLAWDNWRFLHAAGGTPGKYRRTMWTVVIRGGPVFGRVVEPGEFLAA